MDGKIIDKSRFGVDVSLYQKGFDLAEAVEEGASFAILKTSQFDFVDPLFTTHYNNAKARGLYVGAYHYLTALDTESAVREADFMIKNCLKGRVFEYPIFADCEDVLLRRLPKSEVNRIIDTFCKRLEEKGYWAGFYCNFDFYRNNCSGAELAGRFSYWHAAWTSSPLTDDCQMWQFGGETNHLRSPKIAGVTIDQNYSFVDFPTLITLKGLNGYKAGDTPPSREGAVMPDLTGDKLKIGQKVTMRRDAPIYGMVGHFADWVYDSVLFVREINGNRIVVSTKKTGAVTGAVDAKYLDRV